MSALDLTRCETAIRRCVATLLHASYTDGIPTETTDVWRTIAADAARDLTALITRLRAAEARTAWQPIETAPLWPASPPAPEVVDVPQPRVLVKRCDEVEAEWTSADATILIVTHDALDDAIFVPLALLRAMLADIDAQQRGAS